MLHRCGGSRIWQTLKKSKSRDLLTFSEVMGYQNDQTSHGAAVIHHFSGMTCKRLLRDDDGWNLLLKTPLEFLHLWMPALGD